MVHMFSCRTCFGVLLVSAAMFGCADRTQEVWNLKRAWGTAVADNIASDDKDHLLDTVQLERLMHAAPDFVGTPGELEELLAPEKDYRNRIMYRAFHTYLQYKGGAFGDLLGDRSWTAHTGFMECTLWIYDESAHFDRPLRGCGAAFGFSASMFFIERDKVIGASGFMGWQPLCAPLPAQPSSDAVRGR